MQLITLEKIYWVAFQAFFVFLIILATAFAARFSRYLIGRVLRHRAPGVSIHVQQYVFWLIWFIGLVLAISQTGFSINVILIVTALVGLSVVLSLRDVARNVFARLALDFYPFFKMGDGIRIANYSGKVIDMNFITTTLLSENDKLVFIPNALFLRKVTVNYTSSARHEVSIPVVIDSHIDITEFERNLLYLCKEYKRELVPGSKPTIVTSRTTDDMHELAILLNIKNPEKKGIIVSEFKERIKKLIDDMS